MTDLVIPDQLRQFAPNALSLTSAAGFLSQHMAACEITTPRHIRHFMAHVAVESAFLTRLEENLNYSVSDLCRVWPSRFPTPASAIPFARNARVLAQKVYGGRMGNNDMLDGYLYRGSGYLMQTGKANFQAASSWVGVDLVANPDLLRAPEMAAAVACNFWLKKGLGAIVDKNPDDNEAIKAETLVINGGETDLALRESALVKANTIWN